MLKKILIPLLLVALQLQAAQKDSNKLSPEEVAKITRAASSCNFNSSCCNSCKCFSCIKAVCAMIDTLLVTGNAEIDGNLTVLGTLTVNGVAVDAVLGTYG